MAGHRRGKPNSAPVDHAVLGDTSPEGLARAREHVAAVHPDGKIVGEYLCKEQAQQEGCGDPLPSLYPVLRVRFPQEESS